VVELSLDHGLGTTWHVRVDVVDHIAERRVFAGPRPWPCDGITIHSADAEHDQTARIIERNAGELHRYTRPRL
jgi:hypothetical protein